MMKDCIFCKIVNKEAPADFIHNDKDVVAFRDINPLAPVHILIIPKEHIEGVQTVEEKHKEILGKILLVARRIAEKKKLKGYKLFFNCGKLGGQDVFHLHLHLIGGWKDLKEYRQWIERRFEEGGVL